MPDPNSHSSVSFLQDLAWRIEAVAFDLFGFLFRLIPLDVASAMGGAALRLIGPLSGAHRTAERNLRIAFPQMDAAERARILKAQWDNLGRTFAEFSSMDRITPDTGRVEVVNMERLHAIAASGEARVLVGGHFANWEVLSTTILASGIKCQVTYRAANNPYIDRSIIESRRRYGVRLFAPKGPAGSREILDAMSEGQSVGLMNDQKFNNGVEAPFFGHPAHTAPGPTRLALRFGGELQPMSVQRIGGVRFRVIVHEPIVLEDTGNRSRDIEAGVRQVNAMVESWVRAKPEDWFWVHRRWPAEVYAALRA